MAGWESREDGEKDSREGRVSRYFLLHSDARIKNA